MLHKILALGAVAAVAASITLDAGAAASSATRVAGTYKVDTKAKVVDSCKSVSPAAPKVMRCTTRGVALLYSGSLTGRSVGDVTWIVDCSTGRTYGHGIESFTGSVNGSKRGASTWGVQFTATFDCAKGTVHGIAATDEVLSGSGPLAGVWGSIRRGPGTYTGLLNVG